MIRSQLRPGQLVLPSSRGRAAPWLIIAVCERVARKRRWITVTYLTEDGTLFTSTMPPEQPVMQKVHDPC